MTTALLPNIKTGNRVRLVSMPDDPDPIPVGTEGTVTLVNPVQMGPDGERNFVQILVKWDNGRSLSCVMPPDQLDVID